MELNWEQSESHYLFFLPVILHLCKSRFSNAKKDRFNTLHGGKGYIIIREGRNNCCTQWTDTARMTYRWSLNSLISVLLCIATLLIFSTSILWQAFLHSVINILPPPKMVTVSSSRISSCQLSEGKEDSPSAEEICCAYLSNALTHFSSAYNLCSILNKGCPQWFFWACSG